MPSTHHHAEWLSLVEVSGPFVTMPVLEKVFPQGLDAHDPDHVRDLRLAFDEWETNQSSHRPNLAIHKAWIDFVLKTTLALPDEVIAKDQAISQTLKATIAEHGETLRPEIVVRNPEGGADAGKPRLLVQSYPPEQDLEKPVAGRHWKASPATRMMELLHATEIRLGLITNGEQWMLVDAPRGDTTGFASWYATLWFEEPLTLRAFRSLLGVRRFFSVGDDETLEAMLAESAKYQNEVTDQLGLQVRHAVEVLIQSLDRADQDDKVLEDVRDTVLYEAALTVMMRLVFLFSAEERGLLLLGDPLYDQHYAVSTLVAQLQEAADQHGEEVLERRYDAWVRLLSTFRAVYGGVQHERMKLPPYGGNLFNPDRFPFLEGREADTSWRTASANPLPVNNRTVLHLLRSLQYLEMQGEARRLSFRALDIEQIGHVYEGLLDHTAKRAAEPMLGLLGAKGSEPEVGLSKLEELNRQDESKLLKFLNEETGRQEKTLKRGVEAPLEGDDAKKLKAACGTDDRLFARVRPFSGLLRNDTFDRPVVIREKSVFVTAGTDRRSSGTHYTPRILTDPIVRYTLEPLIYSGPAEGKPKEEWKLRSARELLDLKICDMACGSGAFLVQACRYLSERLLEAWETDEKLAQVGSQQGMFEQRGKTVRETVRISPYGLASKGGLYEQLVPLDLNERLIYARRIVAQRCLYGVDKNPLAVEMAKLSLWLLTLAKDKPFEFLDHAIRCGDSLVGIHNLDQLRKFNLDGKGEDNSLFLQFLDPKIKEAISLRRQITEMQANTVEDVESQDRLLREANEKIDRLKFAADFLIAAELTPGSAADKRGARDDAAIKVAVHFDDSDLPTFRREAQKALAGQVTFHWPLEFPEVMVERRGFDGFVGNPPFMGGSFLSGRFGVPFREYLVHDLANDKRGNADLCAYFFLRSWQLLRETGQLGFLATNTIAQGDSREVGLEQLTANGCMIFRAVQSRPWPGTANLEVSHVWVRRGNWGGPFVLDERTTNSITAFLTSPGAVTGNPHRLKANEGRSYTGCKVYGQGFVLTPDEAKALFAKDIRNKDVLMPYLDGEDVNSRPDQSPSRWVINFFNWPLAKAKEFTDCFSLVEARVKPERMILRDTADGQRLKEKWWLYGRSRPELYAAISGKSHVFVGVLHTKYWSVACYDPSIIFSHALAVFSASDFGSYSVMESVIHESWAREYSSSLETRMRYTPSDCYETFPFPSTLASLDFVGERYHDLRRQIMLIRQEGLTKTYNRFHEREETSADIQKLRQLHVEMDNAVAAAYGWTDLDLGHGFHETKQGVRYTISDPARREVLARLLKLNHERYTEEVKQGLHDSKAKRGAAAGKPKKATKKTAAASPTVSLFDNTVDTAFPGSDRDRRLCGLLCDLVSAQPDLSSTAYLDALVIALRPNRHTRLLAGKERTQFVTLAEKLLPNSDQSGGSLPWDDIVNLLTTHEAIRTDESKLLAVGSRLAEARTAYPACDQKLIQLIHKAAATLREYQEPSKTAAADSQEVLSAFNEDKRSLCGVTT